MNDVLLINRIKLGKEDVIRNMSFILGDMRDINFADKVISLIKDSGYIEEDITIKYNGVEISMWQSCVPKILKIFLDNEINVYGVYQLY